MCVCMYASFPTQPHTYIYEYNVCEAVWFVEFLREFPWLYFDSLSSKARIFIFWQLYGMSVVRQNFWHLIKNLRKCYYCGLKQQQQQF